MVETIVPVVHGTRSWLISLALFAAGATGSAALLGLLLGAALPGGGRTAVAAVALFALVAAAGEVGLVRLPLPQLRRQVPERWRERYPQPLAALLYGLGLGVGFATYLPVATLIVVAVAVTALLGPAAGAIVLGAFGLGRGLALAAATGRVRSIEQATGRLEQMARIGGRRRLRRLNGLALAALSVLLALGVDTAVARAATQLDLGPDPVADPSAAPNVLAFDRINPDGSLTGVVRIGGVLTDLPGNHPDADGTRLVVDTGPAFEIIDSTTMAVLQTLPLVGTEPALSGDWLVYRHAQTSGRQIVLYNLTTNVSKVIATTPFAADLGAPDISYPRVTYHRTGSERSSVMMYRIDTSASVRLVSSVRYTYSNPSIAGTLIVYVRQTLLGMQLYRLNLATGGEAQLFAIKKSGGRFMWTTGITGWTFFFTMYDNNGGSWIFRSS
jgi:hypothetical protein